jgi:hypothetical protein
LIDHYGLTGSASIFKFTDSRINGGAVTYGILDLTVSHYGGTASSLGDYTVEIHRLVFDDDSTVAPRGVTAANTYTSWTPIPEPSSLALLALGAGGLLARRRRAQAA